MRFLKTYMAFLLTAVLLLTSIPFFPALAADEADAAMEKLKAFGIFEEEELALLKTKSALKRGDFIRLAVRLSGMQPESMVGAQYQLPFTDAARSDANYKFFCVAYELGMIAGATNTALRPGEPVTQEMAAKLLVGVLDYGTIAEQQGGYPYGYQSIASQLKLFAGCDNLEQITGAAAAKMLLNTLEAPVARKTQIGQDSTIDISNRSVLLEERFYIYRTEGILDGTEDTLLLTGNSQIPHGHVSIDGVYYAAGSSRAEEWLGYYVEGYYRGEQGQEKTLLYAAPMHNKNEVLCIDTEDILSADMHKITYAENGKRKTLGISILASLIYNGKHVPLKDQLTGAECGRLTLIDNNRDGAYDVLHMMAYRTIVASGISATAHTVQDYLGGADIILDPEDQDYHVDMRKGGTAIAIDDLAMWDVLSYAESPEDGTVRKTVLVSQAKAAGTVTALSAAEKKMEIDGVEYPASAAVLSNIKLGYEGTFYIDVFGRVVGSKNERDVVYGFLKAGIKEKLDVYVFKIFTETGNWVELPLRKKVKFNGVSGCMAETVYQALVKNKAVVPQMITYRVSAEREINELNTAQEFSADSPEEEAAIRDGVFRKSLMISSAYYRNNQNSRSFEDLVCVKDAKVFIIPNNPAKAEDSMFVAGNISILKHDDRYSGIDVYDMNDLRCAKMIAISGSRTTSTSYMVVTDINEAVNDDDDTVYAVRGLCGGRQASYYTANKEMVDAMKLRSGDIIKLNINDNGYAESIVRYFAADGGFAQKGISGGPYGAETIVRGQVVRADAAEREMVIDYGSGKGVYTMAGSPSVYLYDPDRKRGSRVTLGTFADIADGDTIFYAARYFDIHAIVLFKKY